MKPELYRNAALYELSSSEQHHMLLKIVPPPKRLFIIALVFPILALILAWLPGIWR